MHPNLPEEYGCVLAASSVDTAIGTMEPVHVSNPHSYPVVIKQNPMVGEAEPVKVVSTISRCENTVRGINFQKQEGCCW